MKYYSLSNILSRFSKPIKAKGFTLIELLLVIAVISILIVTVSVALNPFEQIKKANDGRRKSDLSELQKSLELYYQDNGAYPESTNGDINWGSAGNTNYIPSVPKDPRSGQQYIYTSINNGEAYALYAGLERGSNDPQACTAPGKSCTFNGISISSCGAVPCNYGVSSPNITP